jgi:hypothetical protein
MKSKDNQDPNHVRRGATADGFGWRLRSPTSTADAEVYAASTGVNARAQQRSVTSAGVGYDPIAVIPASPIASDSEFRAALRAVRTPEGREEVIRFARETGEGSAISSCAEPSCRFCTTTNPALVAYLDAFSRILAGRFRGRDTSHAARQAICLVSTPLRR